MDNENKNQQAFPTRRVVSGKGEDYWETPEHSGLTKREYFAGLAMQGYLASYDTEHCPQPEDLARQAIEYADELLKQLSQ